MYIILLCPDSPVSDIDYDEGFVSENPFVDPRRLRRFKGRRIGRGEYFTVSTAAAAATRCIISYYY